MQQNKKEIYTCKEHVEVALDDIVNECEKAPQIEENSSKKCDYCEKLCEYIVFA